MTPKDFDKKRKAVKDIWAEYMSELANRLYKKTYDTQLIRWGNTYYKRITDARGNVTVGCSLDPAGEFFPMYDENGDARWKYETLNDYQDSVMRWIGLFYEQVLKVPSYGFANCGYAKIGDKYVTIVSADHYFDD